MIDSFLLTIDDCNPTDSIYTSPSYLEIDKWLHASVMYFTNYLLSILQSNSYVIIILKSLALKFMN